MSLPYDPEAVWMKAKNFINRSFDALDDDDFPRAALWAANSLELLAGSTLCQINPLLVADPSDDGRSLMLAAGLPGDTTRYRSIPAKALFSRCARAFRPFNREEAMEIAAQRNAELHSGATPYSEIKDRQSWWERFWSNAETLLDHRGCSIEDFVGPGRSADVQAHLLRGKQNVRRRVDSLVEAADQRLALGIAPPKRLGIIPELDSYVECPVCGDAALLGGDDIEHSELVVDGDQDGIWGYELVQVEADCFQCENCGLMLEGWAYISAAGLPTTFEIERPYEPDDDYYLNE